MKIENRRNLEIDTARGIACILLVTFHVIGNNLETGLHFEEGSNLRVVSDYLSYLRMPLFTFLSGMVYARRAFSGDVIGFIKGKARRLLLPMIFVGTIFAVLQKIVPGTNSQIDNIYLIHILPVSHFWFIESLFIVFFAVMLLEKNNVLSSPTGFCISFVASVALYLWVGGSHYFSIKGAIYLAPFFLAGLAVGRFDINLNKARPYLLFLLVAIFIVLLSSDFLPERRSLIALIIGVMFSFLIVRSGLSNKYLAYIGGFSYSIYLFHTFFTASSRILLQFLGLQMIEVFFVIGIMVGLLGPVLLEIAFGDKYFLRTALFGKR